MQGIATAKQICFLEDLALHRDEALLVGDQRARIDVIVKHLSLHHDPEEQSISKRQASQWIEWLLTLPKMPVTRNTDFTRAMQAHVTVPASARTPQQPYPDVPKGRYGLGDESRPDTLRFYRVSRSRDNKWTRVHRVEDVTGTGRPRHTYIRNAAEKRSILQAILDDARGLTELMAFYGRHLGSCGRCGQTLTDDYSRLAGLGPHCRMLLNVPVDPALKERAKVVAAAKQSVHGSEVYARQEAATQLAIPSDFTVAMRQLGN